MRSIVIWSFTAGRQALSLDPILRCLRTARPDSPVPVCVSRRPRRSHVQLLLAASLCTLLAACDSDLRTDIEDGDDTPSDIDNLPPTGTNGSASNNLLTLTVGNGAIELQEGSTLVTTVPVSIVRQAGAPATIGLSARLEDSDDERYTSMSFTDATLDSSETVSTLGLQLAIGALPIQAENRTLIVTASDGDTPILSTSFDFRVSPTDLPDVYLLVGQSNMVGFSEDGSKQAGLGQPDAPNERILQLNVTGNDGENFASPADFTNPDSNYNSGLPLTPAVDPLHDGYDSRTNGKAGDRIGPALSFAKEALVGTTTDIYLVPAAWPDTGFCKRDTNRFPGIGWNATAKNNDALSGTLLYERAVERADIALSQTSGILRGILWHQGEGDSDTAACAETYASNLTELAAALRTNIQQDARGAVARGENADVPFIVGTMSRGSDVRGDLLPYSDTKQLVDDVHRNIANLVPLSNVVINDDLVPPGYPCGEGSCIHFGAAAYRLMGQRYYDALLRAFP